ncbi:multicopper oxidase family protein [Nitrosomonas supralitoralis]|uniref:Multicopper oxidase CueO n=1 Tax=Nitrosomonas supralitoralis TaxID=2116706 RepID=A0A2P7NYL6_9PROT|nr:multicopper oxidase domain-containing protein [Nitrosomonas supralitoralis]PSJ18558.1 bilirubin oxidase [Nitrosomonas supralitoralis]PSJ18560.1 bilirubin oxidase [Nitrosomonas supralitoralis]
MSKKIINSTYSGKQEKAVARYMQEVRDIVAAKLSRRDLLKLGLTASAGGLVSVSGTAFFPNLAVAGASNIHISPPCNKPWTDLLPIPKTCVPAAGDVFSGPPEDHYGCKEKDNRWHPGMNDYYDFKEGRTESHQRWDELGGSAAITARYELMAKEIDWNFYSDVEYPGFNSKVWTYVDLNSDAIGVLRIKAQYQKPIIMRMYNGLPKNGNDNQGFGINQITPHLHNAHNPHTSDGGPMRFYDSGTWWDHWYPNIRAGFASTHKNGTTYNGNWCPGDWQETQSTFWFHDHRFDFTAPNVYKGLASFYTLFSDDIKLDTDDETTGLRLPSGEYDIPMLITDKSFDSTGQMFWDPFMTEGFLGDQQTVNFKIKPKLYVKRRKYRIRFLNAGPSRFIEVSLSNNSNFTRIANCGNLLPKAQIVPSIRLGVAERGDVIVDFSQYAPGTEFYLENRLEQISGQGTTGKRLASSDKTRLLKFIVSDEAVMDESADMSTLQTQTMVPMPVTAKNPAVKKRSFSFSSLNGAWVVNDKLFDPGVISAYPVDGTSELWTLKSGGGWSHPIHIHFEEFQLVSRNGKASNLDIEDKSRKDVVRIGQAAVGTAGSGEVQLYMQFRDWHGDYPMHCHNVVHEDHAMMVLWKVVPPNDPNAGK